MATYTKQILSGSVDGRTIPVAATATPGTLIHTAIAGQASYDEVYIWASNGTAADATLTIEWGGVGNPTDHAVHAITIPAGCYLFPIITGLVLRNGLIIRAFSGTASAINILGFVNRIV